RCDERLERLSVCGDPGIKANLSAALDCAEHHRLTRGSASLNLSRSYVLVHVLGLAADVRFVALNNAREERRVGILDRLANSMAQIPCGLVGYLQSAFELKSGNPLLRLAHQIDSRKPLWQRQVRVVKDRSGS